MKKKEVSYGALMYHALGATFLIGGVIADNPKTIVAGVAGGVIATAWQYIRQK